MVSVGTGAMSSLLGTLGTLLCDEYKLQTRVKREITFLKDELSSMNAFLEKLADMDVIDPQTKEWRNQVREMAYDIEDCIDEYICCLKHEPHKQRGILEFFRKSVKKVKKLGSRHGIAEQIQEIKVRIVDANQRRERYKLDEAINSSCTNMVPIDPRMPALYADAVSLVGVDGPKKELIKLLSIEEQPLKVISIVGFGGLGKTTLANQVYKEVGAQFDCCAFVSVSQKPDTMKILQIIHSRVMKIEYANANSADVEGLVNTLRDFLEKKRYFIVIDDIWGVEAWKTIKCALPANTHGSRIIVTTRNATVAKSCCSPHHGHVYELRPLSEADSKNLFFKRIFGLEAQCPVHLKEVSLGIVKKCGGLPLAIITMASLLTTKSDRREEWVSIHDSIGLGLEKNSDMEEMRRILSLSYSDLPHYLKTCLLYLSMYPEDYEINVQQLVRRWIAEGFIKSERNLVEEGISYLNELINRSLIQPVGMNFDGQAHTCRVHDVILDVIVSKAAKENFVNFVCDPDSLVSQDKVRRLSLDYRGQKNAKPVPSMVTAHLRSLVIFGEDLVPIHHFHALRVLDIECNKMVENWDIGKLFQLRYLRISGRIRQLSGEIGRLQFLETLDLENSNISDLPASVVKLQQLKCLRANGALLLDGVRNMEALEELTGVDVNDKTSVNALQELASLTKLRILKIYWLLRNSHSEKTTYVNMLSSSLSKLSSNLRDLRINSFELFCDDIAMDFWSSPPYFLRELDITGFCLQEIPEWITAQASLVDLSIRVKQVTQKGLEILGGLPALLYLHLYSTEDATERLSVCSNQFSCLMVLCFSFYLVDLMLEAGAMMKLETLLVKVMPRRVQSVSVYPNICFHHLSSLRELRVWINCEGARVDEVEAFEVSIRSAANLHLNCPELTLYRRKENEMMKTGAFPEESDREQEDILAHCSEALTSSASN